MCDICDRLAMRVIPINFTDIPDEEKKRIIQAIEQAYKGTGRRAYVVDEYRNPRRRCPAYAPDVDGGQAIVHEGHCTGAFEGIEKCKCYDASKFYIAEQCRFRAKRRKE